MVANRDGHETGMGRTRDTLGAGLTAHLSDSKLHQPSMLPAFQMAANNIQLQLYLVAMLTWGFCTCPVAIWQFSSPWFWFVISVFGNQKPNCRDSHLFFQVALLSAIIVFHFYCLSYWAVVDISSHRGGKKDELCRQKTKQTKKQLTGSTIVLHVAQWHFYHSAQLLLSTPERERVWQRAITRETHQMYTVRLISFMLGKHKAGAAQTHGERGSWADKWNLVHNTHKSTHYRKWWIMSHWWPQLDTDMHTPHLQLTDSTFSATFPISNINRNMFAWHCITQNKRL